MTVLHIGGVLDRIDDVDNEVAADTLHRKAFGVGLGVCVLSGRPAAAERTAGLARCRLDPDGVLLAFLVLFAVTFGNACLLRALIANWRAFDRFGKQSGGKLFRTGVKELVRLVDLRKLLLQAAQTIVVHAYA